MKKEKKNRNFFRCKNMSHILAVVWLFLKLAPEENIFFSKQNIGRILIFFCINEVAFVVSSVAVIQSSFPFFFLICQNRWSGCVPNIWQCNQNKSVEIERSRCPFPDWIGQAKNVIFRVGMISNENCFFVVSKQAKWWT